MARNKGTFNFAANFEVLAKAPLDARMLVGGYTDLVLPATWEDDDNNVWLFDGAIVVVSSDPSSGIYWLKDSANYTTYSSWERLESGSVSVLNVGDGSANVYAGVDSSGNIQLRTISGSGGTTVEQVGEQIIIGIDASYSGESNYGVNVGTGDASIYVQKVGDALQFREIVSDSSALIIDVSGNLIVIDTSIASSTGVINYGENVGIGDASIYVQNVSDNLQFREIKSTTSDLIISVSDNLVLFDTSISAPLGEAIDGGVWITNITPTSGGNVGDKVYSSDGNVLDSCLTDVSALTVAVLALPGHTNYKPIVTINDVSVSLSEGDNQPLWVGTYPMTYTFADASITVHHEDGAQWSTTVDGDTPATVLSAEFTNGYPGSQTELKAGDTFDVSIVTDVPIVSVEVDDYGALSSGTFSVSGTNVGFTGTIANRGTSLQNLGMRIRVVKSTGSTSVNYLSESQGSVDGKDLVALNNLYPTVSFGSISYPTGQSAIKSPEDASVANTVTNYDTLTYSSPTGEIGFFGGTTTYQNPKRVQYTSGTYNISTNNVRIIANRAANDATTTQNTVVWIANTPTTLSVANPAARLRSGGNDGTAAQSHTITITASQRLLAAPSLVKGTGGTWLGGGFTWSAGATSFTRSLQVVDSESKGTYSWGSILGTNLANIPTTANLGATQYILGGFVRRTITLAAFGWQSNINVEVSDYSKLSSTGSGDDLVWTTSTMHTRSTIGDVTRPQADVWSASATFTNPTTINILDKSATDGTSVASTFTIQEGI